MCAGNNPCAYNNRVANRATANTGGLVEVYFANSSGVVQRDRYAYGDAYQPPNGTSLYDRAFCQYYTYADTHLSCTVANG